MTFMAELLDPRISYGFVSEPRFTTIRTQLPSGVINRNILHEDPTYYYTVTFDTLSIVQTISTVAAYQDLQKLFFRSRAARSFLFKDWSDFELDAEEFATGVNGDQTYQLTKTYGSAGDGFDYTRNIVKPVTSATVFGFSDREPMRFFVDGVEDTSATVDSDGIVTFNTSITGGESLTATGHFDVPVMFERDDFPMTYWQFELGSVNINLVEDKGV